jgi:hypothetical protein
MARQIAVSRVDLRVVKAGGNDAALEVVGNQEGGDAAEVFKGADMAADPVGQGLAPGRLAVGVVGGAEHGDEDGGLADFTAHRVDDGHGRPRVVDEQFLARGMGLAQAHRKPPNPLPVVIAETAVAVAVRMLRLVFLPEEVERDALAPQLAMHGRPIGFGPGQTRWRRRRIKLGFQPRLAERGRQRPGDVALLGSAEDLAHCRRRGIDRSGDLSMAEAALVVQP